MADQSIGLPPPWARPERGDLLGQRPSAGELFGHWIEIATLVLTGIVQHGMPAESLVGDGQQLPSKLTQAYSTQSCVKAAPKRIPVGFPTLVE